MADKCAACGILAGGGHTEDHVEEKVVRYCMWEDVYARKGIPKDKVLKGRLKICSHCSHESERRVLHLSVDRSRETKGEDGL